jgi:hypothetical protein
MLKIFTKTKEILNYCLKKRVFYFSYTIILLVHSSAISQINGVTPKSISMGLAGTVYSKGLNAISINPANLAYSSDYHWSFNLLPNIFVNLENNIFDLETYSKYFTGIDNGKGGRSPKYLNEQDKQELLNLFPTNGRGEIFVFPEINIFSIGCNYDGLLGGIALSIKERGFGNVSLPRDALKLLLYGNSINSQYNFNQTNVFVSWIREFSLSYGGIMYTDQDKNIAAGISLKYLYGNAFFEIDKCNSNFMTTDSSIKGRLNLHSFSSSADFLNDKGNFSLFGDPAGVGFAVDVGFSLMFSNTLSFGMSLTDLGSITWEKNTETISVDTLTEIIDILNEDQFKPFEDIIDRHKQKNIGSKTIQLPLGFHIGAQAEIHNFEYFKKLNLFPLTVTSDFHYVTNPNLDGKIFYLYSFGMEAKFIKWLPVRTGFSIGTLPFALSFGLGINTTKFDLDLGLGNFLALFSAGQTKKVSLAFGTLFKF